MEILDAYLPGCTGKTAYNSASSAIRQSDRFRRKHPGTRLHPYLCRYCQEWHLTSLSRAESERTRDAARQRRK